VSAAAAAKGGAKRACSVIRKILGAAV